MNLEEKYISFLTSEQFTKMDEIEKYSGREGFFTIKKGSPNVSKGFLMCQGVVLLSGELVGIGHFYHFYKDVFDEYVSRMQKHTKRKIKFALISGYSEDHKLWKTSLEEIFEKAAEFSDSYTPEIHYDKDVVATTKEIIIQLRPHIISPSGCKYGQISYMKIY